MSMTHFDTEQNQCPRCNSKALRVAITTNEQRDRFGQIGICNHCGKRWTQPLSAETIAKLVAIAQARGDAHKLPAAWLETPS